MEEWFKPLRTTGRAAILVSTSSCPQRVLLNIGIVKMTESSGTRSLTEAPTSPASDRNTITLESIGELPPRLL